MNNTLTESEFDHYCSFREGSAVRFDIVGTDDDSSRLHTLDFFYHDLLNSIDTVQFWTVHSTSRISLIEDSFHGISILQCSAITSTYVDELMGDATQCGLLVSYFEKFLATENLKESAVVTAEDTLSTQCIQDAISLKSKEPNFAMFRDLVDDRIKEAIQNIYGEFSTFTSPIITQSMLSNFDNAFCQMLPVQYHTHQTMMGRPVNLDLRRKNELREWLSFMKKYFTNVPKIQEMMLLTACLNDSKIKLIKT